MVFALLPHYSKLLSGPVIIISPKGGGELPMQLGTFSGDIWELMVCLFVCLFSLLEKVAPVKNLHPDLR